MNPMMDTENALMNGIDTKISPYYNKEMWQIRSSATYGKYTRACFDYFKTFFTKKRTARFY